MTELSAAEAATVAAFDAAPYPPEVLREKAARALHDDDCDCEEWPCSDGWHRKYRRMADAALAVVQQQDTTAAVQRVLALCDQFSVPNPARRFVHVETIRAAVAGPSDV